MNARSGGPRDSTVQPFEGYPALGAFHDVIPSEQLHNFLYDFRRIAEYVLKRSEVGLGFDVIEKEDFKNPDFFEEANKDIDKHPQLDGFDFRNYGKIFDLDRLGVSVVEMGQSARTARAIRAVWERQDFGAVEQEARDEVDRFLGMSQLSLKFSGVMGAGRKLPEIDKKEVRQKLALLPEGAANQGAIELLGTEAEIITDAINRRLKQFLGSWDIVPHLTFAYFKQNTNPDAVRAIEASADNYSRLFPCGAQLGSLMFRHISTRTKKSRR